MQSVKLSKPGLFLMFGYAGAGKTFFGRQFAKSINGFHLSSDRLRQLLFDEPEFSREENNVVFGLMEYMAEELLSSGVSVVYDAQNNIRSQRKSLAAMASRCNAFSLVVWVQTDVNTAFERASQRDRRNPDDKYAFAIEKEVFSRLKDEMTKPQNDENYIVLSGKHNFKSQLLALSKLLQRQGLLVPAASSSSSDAPQTPQIQKDISLGGRVDMSRRSIPRPN